VYGVSCELFSRKRAWPDRLVVTAERLAVRACARLFGVVSCNCAASVCGRQSLRTVFAIREYDQDAESRLREFTLRRGGADADVFSLLGCADAEATTSFERTQH